MVFEEFIVFLNQIGVISVKSEELVFISNNSFFEFLLSFDGFGEHVFLPHKIESFLFGFLDFLISDKKLVLFRETINNFG